jgi:hypothetical protein
LDDAVGGRILHDDHAYRRHLRDVGRVAGANLVLLSYLIIVDVDAFAYGVRGVTESLDPLALEQPKGSRYG